MEKRKEEEKVEESCFDLISSCIIAKQLETNVETPGQLTLAHCRAS
jgi:hypothetical protein